MKITGIGPKTGIQASLYLIIMIVLHYLTIPAFQITQNQYSILLLIGIILFLTGSVLLLIMAVKLQRSFKNDILMTDGFYRVFRNPMYAMYILFLIPGLSLILNSWLVLTAALVMYFLISIYIKEEYQYLEAKYGEEYRNYLKKVWVKFL